MTRPLHPLVERLVHKVGGTVDERPSLEAWQALLGLVSRTYHDADQDRYTLERSIDISSREMQGLYQELKRKSDSELASLRNSEERHRVLFVGNPAPIYVFDVETFRFLAVNDAMVQLYGYTRDEFLAMSIVDLKPPEDVPGLVASLRDRVLGQVLRIGIRRHRRKDGGVLEMDITSHVIAFEGRYAVFSIAIDQTQARRLEEQLLQAQKMDALGQLAGGIAHDFNNILATVLASADLALATVGADHPAAPDLAEIERAALRAAGLTQQLLAFSRKQPRRPTLLALNAIVTRAQTMLSRLVGAHITMISDLAADLGTIEADAGQLEQLLMNLVVNARDAMPEGGRLVIETSSADIDDVEAPQLGVAAGRYAVLTVTDTGCGMSAATRARIFEPFFTTKAVNKGTGLGLSTVFGIVKQSLGAITVESEPDHGTTFSVYLPCTDAVIPARAISPPRFVPRPGSGTILVVEDDDQVRRILMRYLASWGYTLLEASDGVVALELARAHAGVIDLLLTDLVMPRMDGVTLSGHLVAARPGLKVVFMSGYTEHPTLGEVAIGAHDHFLQKPFAARELSETIHDALAATVREPARP